MPLHLDYRPKNLSELFGNEDIKSGLESIFNRKTDFPHAFMFHGPTGCVDKDTEFLSPKGWIKISEYKKGTKVLQYNSDGSAEFVLPLRYIKKTAKHLNLIKTKYGVNQCLCDDHRLVYFLKNDTDIFEKTMADLKKQHEQSIHGFSGRFKTTFHPKIETCLPLTDAELRIQVMVIADSHIPINRKKCVVNVKKKRKIERAENLLKEANITFDRCNKENGFTSFNFIPPMRCKEFTPEFFRCSPHQLEIIVDEVLKWDGSERFQQFSSKSKTSIDFVQYAFASVNKRASIYENNFQYTLSITNRNFIGICSSKPNRKVKIQKYRTVDGFKYCFQVPSSYLVLRREGNIFITGNCGKTTLARIVANLLECDNPEEYNMSNLRGIDAVRSIVENSAYLPITGRNKVYILDEIHRQTKDAQNALLKPLEDAFSHVYYIVCTTNPERLLPALKGRCHKYQVKPLKIKETISLLQHVLKKEKVTDFPKSVLRQIAILSNGFPRNALVLLDSVIDVEDEKTALDVLSTVTAEDADTLALCRAIVEKTPWEKTQKILIPLLEDGEPEQIQLAVLGYLTNTLLGSKRNDRVSDLILLFSNNIFYAGKASIVNMVYMAVTSK